MSQPLFAVSAPSAAVVIERVEHLVDRVIAWWYTLIRADPFAMMARFDAHSEYHLDVGTN